MQPLWAAAVAIPAVIIKVAMSSRHKRKDTLSERQVPGLCPHDMLRWLPGPPGLM